MSQAPLQALLDRQIKPGRIYNVVARVQSQDGALDLAAAAGTADPAASQPMTVDTPYFIASVTKMVTAATVLHLYGLGQLDLDTAIAAYLPADMLDGLHVLQGKDYSQQITVAHLVNQTSGLPDYFDGKPRGGRSVADDLRAGRDRTLDLDEMLAITRGLTPKFAPGSGKAHYADTNYQLLGAIITAVTGKSLASMFHEVVFAPLGLQHTYLYGTQSPPGDPPPAALYYRDRAVQAPNFMAAAGPDGGLVSTAAESMTFLRAFFDGKLFDPALLARMTARWHTVFFPIQYGYGLMRFKLPRLFSPFRPIPSFIGHSGSTGSFAFHCPARKLYLTGTVNQFASPSKPFQLMVQIVNALG